MKTNHRRDFVARKERSQHAALMRGRSIRLTDKAITVSTGGDATNGHRGEAKMKKGAKKHLRTRQRSDGKRAIKDSGES